MKISQMPPVRLRSGLHRGSHQLKSPTRLTRRGWYLNNWTLDLAVQEVRFADGEAQITVANRGQLVMPAVMELTFQDGSSTRIALPAETWMQKTTYMLHLESKQPIASVVIDPDHVIPDNDRSNNLWKK